MPSAVFYTLSQIAAALGSPHRTSVRRRLGAPDGTVDVRGKANADGWSEASIDNDILAELGRNAAQHFRRSVAHLLSDPPPLYRPPIKPDASAEQFARLLMDVSASLLTTRGTSTHAQLARTVRERLVPILRGEVPAHSTIETWLHEILKRDAGWNRFNRVELYYDLARRPAAVRTEYVGEPVAVDSILGDDATARDEKVLWRVAFEWYDALCASGQSARLARRECLAGLTVSGGLLAGISANAIRQRWDRNHAIWKSSGGDPSAFRDRRRKPPNGKCAGGRKPKFDLTTAEKSALRRLVLKTDSLALSVEWFAKAPECLPETRALILEELDRAAQLGIKPKWPDSIRRAGHVSEDEKRKFRGAKSFQSVEFFDRRCNEWIDLDGNRLPVLPNTIWESDDMSSNEPFTWLDPQASGGFHHRIGRQTLCTLDVFACNWLGVSPIGRERDAYRAEDIAEHMADCVAQHGLPTVWRLERGVWENNFIDGTPVGVDADGNTIRWGGLDAIIHITRAFKSKGKGTVESSFDFLQTLLAHESTSIGRHRGEFEEATKLMLSANRGDLKAWGKFWPIDRCADAFAEAMREFNHRPKKRRAHGRGLVVPADLYRGAIRKECPASELWRFCPEKREATVRGGHVECVSKHYPLPFRFRVNGTDALYLEHGYKVLIAFHPGHPERGCHIFNNETGTMNREGHEFGKFLVVAPMADDAPQVNLAPQDRAFAARKNANAALRAEFRAIVPMGREAARSSVVRNGYGDSARRDTHPREASEAPAAVRGKELAAAAHLLRGDCDRAIERAADAESRAIRDGFLTPL